MAIVYLTRRATFCAAHRLHDPEFSDEQNRRIYGICNNPNGHGHNYELEVTLRGEVDPKTGMVINLADLKQIMHEVIVDRIDHKNLNLDVPELKGINPSAENMVVVFWKLLQPELPKGLLYEVRLRETENNVSVYRGE